MSKRNTKDANSRNTKNIATETMDSDNLEIAKLQEQVRQLQLENNVLRQNLKELEKKVPGNMSQLKLSKSPNIEKSGCACKRNCSSKMCGCVKKENKCNSSCKCNNTMCQNQEMKHSETNKENVDKNDMRTPKKQIKKTRKKEALEEIRTIKSLTPDSSLNSEGCKTSKVTFDPMKPRHQLSRTPPNKTIANKIIKDDNLQDAIFQSRSQLHYEPIEETKILAPSPTTQVQEEAVDWEQHTAQLIRCKKCERTFTPDRIQKHEACCKKI
ncbi:hypothetical protein DMN91_004603 [Ooceraea biroi]|uniref:C2HC/C3H-type domain-containing protein n=1 Tax=Ooceraea biroi TaxID=2015173 RepID=A0A3L8DPG5_OOCBI|nr:uncharacterized protein LOC105287649 [Ooceraea biroi]RLU22325.1 hypothetical protein DMN91_004603 [Ooceraea biroi]